MALVMILALVLLIMSFNFGASATCYFADGISEATDFVPCDTTADISTCCPSHSFCTTSGLCLGATGYGRGSCTDPEWGAPCNKVCPSFFPQGGMPVTACNLDKVFACDFPYPGQDEKGNCLDNFTIPDPIQIVLRVDQVAGLGMSTPLTLGPTATVPVPDSSCAATVTGGLRFSTVSQALSSY